MSIRQDPLASLEAKVCSRGDTVHYNDPIRVFCQCDGNYLIDEDGNRYLDFQMAYSSANFGYKNTHFERALLDQVRVLPQLASEYVSKSKVELCACIASSAEERWGCTGRVHLNVGGSQAIEDALKLVAANRGRRRVFAFEGSYHGRTIAASSISSSFRYRSRFGDFPDRAYFIPFPYCFRCPYGKKRESCNLFCVRQFDRLFESEYHGIKDIRSNSLEYVAFFAETIQGTGGYIVPPEGYFSALKRILDREGILFAVDDIQMGFYRTGKLWSVEHFGVEPDVLIFGKSLTNGLNPLSGLWAKEALISPSQFPPGSTHSTFASNPLGCRLGVATFEWIKANDYGSLVRERGDELLNALRELQKQHPEFGDVDGLGLAIRIEICHEDGFTPNRELTEKIKSLALDNSVPTTDGPLRLVLDIGGYYKNVITLAPPLDVTSREISHFITILDHATATAKQELA